jgi:hypothetical protein
MINATVSLLLVSILMSAICTSLILNNMQQGRENNAHTQKLINHKIDVISNQTRNDAIILAALQNLTATHEHHILEQINSTVNHTK